MTNSAVNDVSDGRRRLLDTALKLFAARGFDSVPVREIAAEASVSIGLIKHHFGSKEGLRAAVDDQFMAQFEEALSLTPEVAVGDTPRAEDFASSVDEWIGRHQGSWPDTMNYFRRALLEESDWGYALFARFYGIAQRAASRLDASGQIGPHVDRQWLPFLMVYLELGTLLLEPYVRRTLGRSGFEDDLWRRRHRAYLSLIGRGVAP